MKTIQMKQRQKGFTIIELVVVILLLGILAATALPRFMDVTDEAHDASVTGVHSGLRTGLALFEAQYIARREATTAMPDFGNLFPTAGGFPAGANADEVAGTDNNLIDTHANCAEIFNGLLQGGRPSLITPASTVFNGTDEINGITAPDAMDEDAPKTTATAISDKFVAYAAATGRYDYLATLTAEGACAYMYLRDAGDLAAPRQITYNGTTMTLSL